MPIDFSERCGGIKRIGELIVFEGPDGSGKTTISKLLVEEIVKRGKKCIWLGFPGREPGTLGAEVYALHHDPRFVQAPALSVQLLHIAAHIEAIVRQILPALAEGTWIVLDRYWWSTWVYGLAAGADSGDLELALDIERRHWESVLPSVVFMITRDSPKLENTEQAELSTLQKLYAQLADRQRLYHLVSIVRNDGTIEEALHRVVATTFSFAPEPR